MFTHYLQSFKLVTKLVMVSTRSLVQGKSSYKLYQDKEWRCYIIWPEEECEKEHV